MKRHPTSLRALLAPPGSETLTLLLPPDVLTELDAAAAEHQCGPEEVVVGLVRGLLVPPRPVRRARTSRALTQR